MSQDSVRKISKAVLDRHLHDEHPVLDCLDNSLKHIQPYWIVTRKQLADNFLAMLTLDWQFQYNNEEDTLCNNDIYGKNVSIYLSFWGPISLMLLTHIVHNSPFSDTKFKVLSSGLIDFLLILTSAFAMYVFSNVLKTPFNFYVQHLCLSSNIGLVTLLYSIICASSPDIVLIPMSLIYFCTCVYLHFSIYNRLIKPTLLEMCILFLLIFTLYLVATIMFYANYSIFWKNTHPILPVKSTHNTPPFVNRNYPE